MNASMSTILPVFVKQVMTVENLKIIYLQLCLHKPWTVTHVLDRRTLMYWIHCWDLFLAFGSKHEFLIETVSALKQPFPCS